MNEDMNITSAQWVSDEEDTIKAIIDGSTLFVGAQAGNRHYDEIMRQVAAGDLTIADAD
jgi:hypothetical protein